MFEDLKKHLKDYYRTLSVKNPAIKLPYNPLQKELDDFASAHPEATAMQLKKALYEIIGKNVKVVLFPGDPFFFETALRVAELGGHSVLGTGGWLLNRNLPLFEEASKEDYFHHLNGEKLALHLAYGPYCDYDHHCFPYKNVLEKGLSGIMEEIRIASENCMDPEKQEFYDTASAGILAVKNLAGKFAAEAARKLPGASGKEKKYLTMIREAALHVPWNPPRTFYEGLAAMKFLYETGCIMDGVNMSVLGAPDRYLYDLYKADIASGRLTEKEAYELISIWMLHEDCRLQLEKVLTEQYNGGEQGNTLILGGLDITGNDISNELSKMFLLAHREQNLVYPKIHCRINSKTPDWFLELAAEDFLHGRNVYSFLNDAVIIPAQCLAGKEKKDAVDYVAGGCWEIILEGAEQSQGAHCYFSLGKLLDLVIQATEEEQKLLGMDFARPDTAESFEALYIHCLDHLKKAVKNMLERFEKYGKLWSKINPSPYLSSCMKNCIKNGKDYTAGGAKYNPHGIPFSGVAVYIDSLLAIKEICFEKLLCSLPEFLDAVRNNWKGKEILQQAAVHASHFGDGTEKSAALTARFLTDIADYVDTFKNESGGRFQCGLYSYSDIVNWASATRATPDGRFTGDYLASGYTPTRLHPGNISDIFHNSAALPLKRFPASSVLTLSINRSGLDVKKFAALLKVWQKMECGAMLQINVLSRQLLEDAVKNPHEHQDLTVRLYGYSARFVTLDDKRRKEFMSRTIL